MAPLPVPRSAIAVASARSRASARSTTSSVSGRGISTAGVTSSSSDQNSWCPRMYATGSPCRRLLINCWNDQPAAAGSARSGAARKSVRDNPVTYSSSSSASRRAERTSARAAASRYAARRRWSESRTIAHRHSIVGRNRLPATHHARLPERYRNDRQDADAAAPPLRHRAVRAVPEARVRESRRLDQGPHRPVDDRAGGEARRSQARRHDRRGDRRQHRPRPRAGRRAEGLSS